MPILDKALTIMLRKEKIEFLSEQIQEIESYIAECESQYDLTDYNWEFSYYYKIPYSEYPKELQEEINYAWSSIEKIEEKIRSLKEFYNQ